VGSQTLLHRGRYAVADDIVPASQSAKRKVLAWIGITNEFSWRDQLVYFLMIGAAVLILSVLLVGTVWNLFVDVPVSSWESFWRAYIWIPAVLGLVTTVWLSIGGVFELTNMFRRLAIVKRDSSDDGRVGLTPAGVESPAFGTNDPVSIPDPVE